MQVEGRAKKYGVAILVEHRQQPARLVGRQAVVFQCPAQVEFGVNRVLEGHAIQELVIGAISQSVVFGNLGTVDG